MNNEGGSGARSGCSKTKNKTRKKKRRRAKKKLMQVVVSDIQVEQKNTGRLHDFFFFCKSFGKHCGAERLAAR